MRSTSIIRNGQLCYEWQAVCHTIAVGTPAWRAWLATAPSFIFEHESGRFTARRERAQNGRGGSYWRAYHTYKGTLHRIYLGKTETLTLARLQEVAQGFAQRHQPALLNTKLIIPPPAAYVLVRPRLIRRLQGAKSHRLTLLSAPAGFGKTTLLSEWCAGSQGKIAWLSLDESDNDSIRFWTYFIAALGTVQKGMGKQAQSLLSSLQSPPMEDVLTRLINDVAAFPHHMTVILDDYHLIVARPIQAAIEFLLEHLPSNMHLILVGRTVPPISLARLRANGQVCEIDGAELCFTREEAETFLKENMGLMISHDAFTVLESHIEGWITGWYLAAVALRGCADIAGFITAFAGSHRYIIEYFVEEVLNRQSQQLQRFLLQTSIVERLSASLCEALTGEGQSYKILQQLAQANVFITPLDHAKQWYRYHPLFAEALRVQLQEKHDHQVATLHSRASQWYESQGLLIEAIDAALAAADHERAAQLIGEIAISTSTVWVQRDFYLLRKWLSALPLALVQSRAQLCILRAWELFSSVRIDPGVQREDVERWLHVAECLLQSDGADAQTQAMRGEIATISAALALLKGELRQSEALAHQALDLLPAGNMTLRGVAARTLVNVCDSCRGMTINRAVGELLRINRKAKDANTRLNALYVIAGLELRQGHLHQAEAICRQTLRLPSVAPTAAGAFLLLLGYILLEWNDIDAAAEAILDGMDRCKDGGDPGIVWGGYQTLAHIRQIQGDFHGALQALDEITSVFQTHEILVQTPLRDLWEIEIESVRAHVHLAQGNRVAAYQWAQSHRRACADLPLHSRIRVLRTIAEIFLVHQQIDDCLAILADLLQGRDTISRLDELLDLLILQALALSAQGNIAQALTVLAEALALAEPGGYIRVFASAGAPMSTLLARCMRGGKTGCPPLMQSVSKRYLSRVFAACGVIASASQPSASVNVVLSERENEVLHLLIKGRSDREIAQQLILAEGTIKTHLKRIYAKLGVHKRAQAVLRAKELCLI